MGKRRAPSPTSQSNIAISRPMAKVDQSKGMIPPPKGPTRSPSPIQMSRPTSPRNMSPSRSEAAKSALSTSCAHPASLESLKMGSLENLVDSREPSSEANKAATSPPSLRANRKITEVSTIKRQPKSGWL